MVIASESGAVGDREARTSTALQMNFLGELGDPIQISDIRTYSDNSNCESGTSFFFQPGWRNRIVFPHDTI